MNPPEEFYIGWQSRAPRGLSRHLRLTVLLLLVLALTLAVILAAAQTTIGRSVFEWGHPREFSGVLVSQPVPHLLVPRPHAPPGSPGVSRYYLVNPFKFGFPDSQARQFDGQTVALRATLIYRDNQTMLEVVEGSIKALPPAAETPPATASTTIRLGRQTLVGEIVDSKCFLGVMNPGQLTPHRACAIRCISGGIPPVFLIRQPGGGAQYLLLLSATGAPVNQAVLDFVAEPVAITGEITRQGDWLEMRADPATYRRVSQPGAP